MRRLLWLPLAAALGIAGLGVHALAQPGDDFGVLKTTPAAPAAPRTVPAGIEPDPRSAAPAPAAASAPAHRPVNPYPLPPDVGAWMVCATTYVGPDGLNLATQVVRELREKHRLGAYIYNRGDEERRRQDEEHEALKKRYPGVQLKRKIYRVQDQYAVLVGGFKDLDAASAYLPHLKKLPAPKLELEGGKNPYEVMTYQEMDPQTKKQVTKAGLVHPFHNAMVVRNPLVPQSQANKPKWDPFWKQLNENEEFSLLKNPKRYTLVVKEYMGGRTIQQQQQTGGSFLNALGLGGSKAGEALDASAQQAHELARFLRQPAMGFTSWVLHTRYSSVVCVGGFDSPEDPEMQRLQRQITNLKFNSQGGADPIGLVATPIPVEVPRP
ncbi:MAG: hypothetical protein U0840_09055 [Gemmataceae bacterium]